MELQQYREKINQIDTELVRLFMERMAVAAEIASWKQKNGRPVLDAAREAALLEKVKEMAGPDMAGYTEKLYKRILELSRELQTNLLDH